MDRARLEREVQAGDRVAALEMLIAALRANNRAQAFKAFRVWAEMPVPGSVGNPHLNTLMGLVERGDYWGRNDAIRNLRKREAVEEAREAVDCLAHEWEYCKELGKLRITRPSITVESQGQEVQVEWPLVEEGEQGALVFTVYDADNVRTSINGGAEHAPVLISLYGPDSCNVFRVEALPERGKRYYLVDADAADVEIRGGDNVRDFTGLFDDAIEWTMPEPTPSRADLIWRQISSRFAQAAQSAPHSLTDQDRQDAFEVEMLDRAGHTRHCARRMRYAQVDCVCGVGG